MSGRTPGAAGPGHPGATPVTAPPAGRGGRITGTTLAAVTAGTGVTAGTPRPAVTAGATLAAGTAPSSGTAGAAIPAGAPGDDRVGPCHTQGARPAPTARSAVTERPAITAGATGTTGGARRRRTIRGRVITGPTVAAVTA